MLLNKERILSIMLNKMGETKRCIKIVIRELIAKSPYRISGFSRKNLTIILPSNTINICSIIFSFRPIPKPKRYTRQNTKEA